MRAWRPAIHIFAGLNVCIQVITPITLSEALASRITRSMASREVRTGFHTTVAGTYGLFARWSTTPWDWSATCARTSSP